MQRTASTSLLILLSLSVALSPLPAWGLEGSAVRVDLGVDKRETVEARWQETGKTHKNISPWGLASSTQRRDQDSNIGGQIKLRDVQVNTLRRVTYSAPIEAMSKRTHTVAARRYEMRTYKEESYETAKLATIQKEVGGWATKVIDVPITVQTSRSIVVPNQVYSLAPIYKTYIATTSTPIGPLFTTIPATNSFTQWQVVPVSKSRKVKSFEVVPVYYDGPMIEVSGKNKGMTIGNCKINPTMHSLIFTGALVEDASEYLPHLLDAYSYANEGNVCYEPDTGNIYYDVNITPHNASHINELLGKGRIEKVGDHDEIVFQTNPYRIGFYNNWHWTTRVRLTNHLITSKTVEKEIDEPYVENVGQWVTKIVDASYKVQLEHLTNTPQEKSGTTGSGVYWWHYHGPNESCPYEILKPVYRNTANGYYDSTEIDAAKKTALAVGNLSSRLTWNNKLSAPSQFSKVYHHTDTSPWYADDVVLKIATSSHQVFDRSEWRTSIVETTQTVWEKKPLYRVDSWDESTGNFSHSHDDPTVVCDNTHLLSAKPEVTIGNMVAHTATPRLVPYTLPRANKVWATSSIMVTQWVPTTATRSVVAKSVPGVEIVESYSDWSETGALRLGQGTASSEVRTEEVVVGHRNITIPAQTLTPLSVAGGRSSYLSDFGTPTAGVNISGSKLRESQGSSNAMASTVKPTSASTRRTMEKRIAISRSTSLSSVEPRGLNERDARNADFAVPSVKRKNDPEPATPSSLSRDLIGRPKESDKGSKRH